MSGEIEPECATGVFACSFSERPQDEACADYNGRFDDVEDELWLPVIGGIVMCLMGFTIGANDVANSWGTSVGSGAISLRAGTIVAGLCNWLGAVFLGSGTSDTIQNGVTDVEDEDCWACGYCNSQMSVFYGGMFSAILSAAIFLGIATLTSMPVSTTHAIVGGVAGMTIAAVGAECVDWNVTTGLGGILLSWLISPLLAGLIGMISFHLTDQLIIYSKNPRERALYTVPALYGISTFMLIFLILAKFEESGEAELWLLAVVSIAIMIVVIGATYVYLIPVVENNLPSQQEIGNSKLPDPKTVWGKIVYFFSNIKEQGESDVQGLAGADEIAIVEDDKVVKASANDDPFSLRGLSDVPIGQLRRSSAGLLEADKIEDVRREEIEKLAVIDANLTEEQRDAVYVFRYLLVFNAAMESFAHGANDTANAAAAFDAVVGGYQHGLRDCEEEESNRWIMALAGAFIMLGITTMGYRVIETIGRNLTTINYQRGWCMEFSSTMAVVIANWFEFPVSTTHCQIGAVVFVGFASLGPDKVSWGLLGQIVVSWIITIPFSGMVAALFMVMIREGLRN